MKSEEATRQTIADRSQQLTAEITTLETERQEIETRAAIERSELDQAARDIEASKVLVELGEAPVITPADIAKRRKELMSMDARIKEIDAAIAPKREAARILQERAQAAELERRRQAAAELLVQGEKDLEEIRSVLASAIEIYNRIEEAGWEIMRLEHGIPESERTSKLLMIREWNLGPNANPHYAPTLAAELREWERKIESRVNYVKRVTERVE
jgi:chromosome segregation ATPase